MKKPSLNTVIALVVGVLLTWGVMHFAGCNSNTAKAPEGTNAVAK